MSSHPLKTGLCLLLFSAPAISLAQDTRAFNQNASRSNHSRLSLSVTPVFTNPVQAKNDTLLFRGSGAGMQLGLDYRTGAIGIGLVSGFGTSGYDDASIQAFMKRTGLQPDETIVQKSRQQQAYILAGPTFTTGRGIELTAHVKGGAFFNNAGNLQLQRKGAQRVDYQVAAGDKAIRPGFLTGIRLSYAAGSHWAVGLAADYLQTTSTLYQSDARQVGSTPLSLKSTVKDLLAGVSISYNLYGSRDAASGRASGKRSHRDAASGLATGKRSAPAGDHSSGLATGKRQHQPLMAGAGDNDASCGTVTQKTTFADGTVQEMTFACPADAAAFMDRQQNDAPQLRAQNNNTVRSNRSELKSILAEADTDGDGIYETDVTAQVYDDIVLEAGTRVQDHNSSRSNKSSVADHNSSRSNKSASKAAVQDHNSSRSNKSASAVAPGDNTGEEDEAVQQRAGISTSRSNIRTRSAVQSLSEDLFITYGTAIVNEKEVPVRVVYKAKHETAKNSISNVR
ncbi:MAG TPA: hypothetical protein PKC69_03060 [Chitinophagaceae bacterium]|nr:hypothetical protein [Chitinophagaceae bacterium]